MWTQQRAEGSFSVERPRILAHTAALECGASEEPSVSEELRANEIHLRLLVENLTNPQLAEEALALRAHALEALVEGVFLIDLSRPDGPILDANPALGRLTGYAPAELIGQFYGLFQGPESSPTAFAEIQAALRDHQAWSGEVLVYRKDGGQAWHELHLTPVPDSTGLVRHCIGIQTDATERRNLQDCFHEAQKMASLGWLAGGIAHDFNNLLTAILGYCGMLLTNPSPVSLRHGLNEIKKAGDRGAVLTRQLLAFSRRQVPRSRLLDLRTIVADMENMLRRLIGDHFDLTTTADPALGRIKAAPGQVEQILLNLVLNARDAMPDGGAITIEMANAYLDARRFPDPTTARPGPYVLLAVTDTGCGMTEEIRANLFQMLFTTKDPGKGTGLGLFTVKDIVARNGGLINVSSELGRGTRMEIFLPRLELPTGEESAKPPALSTGRGLETVLVVENEPDIRDLIRQALQRQGYTVLEAGNERDALAVSRQHDGPIHLLIAAVTLSALTAAELAAQLARAHPKLRVLYLAEYPPESGAPFLPKPFSLESLPLKVRDVLDRGK